MPRSNPPKTGFSDSADLWAGRIRVTGEVGRGAMGQVLKGRDVKLGRELALKVAPVPKHQIERPLLARFVEEAQVTAQLEHPNVVPIHDMGLDPAGRPYFSMKLVRGESLESILEKRKRGDKETLAKFGVRRLLDVFLQVCQAIEYAHARGVVHRDLKPANIMVGDFGEVLVMDWGVAKLKERPDLGSHEAVSVTAEEASESSESPASIAVENVTSVRAGRTAWATQSGTVVGTPAYMAPEQAKGEEVDDRSDIYALGVLLFEMLCGEVPFDDDDPTVTMMRLVSEPPRPPSSIDPTTPPALEELVLRMLEKDPERRHITIEQIRQHILNYIEGVGLEYRRTSIWASVSWTFGAVVLFAFLVWYLTGRSAATVLALGPPVVLNAVGWFLLVVALGYPLWAALVAFRQSRVEHDRFRPPTSEAIFVSGYLARRTFSAALAPLFQLVFILELVSLAVAQAFSGVHSEDLIPKFSEQMRAQWSQALIVILIFQFAYLFLLSTEVRFARGIDRYDLLVKRPRWESVWPFFLILVLLLTLGTTDVLEWVLAHDEPSLLAFLTEEVMTPPLSLFEIIKNLIFQGTFLLGLVVTTMLLAFPFSELLAALRMPYQPADEASVASRSHYFVRSMSAYQVARAVWLYGGAMIASLTAITVLTEGAQAVLVEKVLYILGPSVIGFVGYSVTRRYVNNYLAHTPMVREMLEAHIPVAQIEQRHTLKSMLRDSQWRFRVAQLTVPLVCILVYLIWTGTGIRQDAIRELILPVKSGDWLIILPYALLVPVLLARDTVQLWLLERQAPDSTPHEPPPDRLTSRS